MSRKIMYCVVALHADGVAVRVFGTFQTADKANQVRDRISRISIAKGDQWRVMVRHVFEEHDGRLALDR